MTTADTSYVPGVCNINREEISKRRNIGHVGLAVLVTLLVVLLLVSVSRYYRIILFLPAMLSASGYLQARNHFCVGYAGAGQQNATPGSDKASEITDAKSKSADKARARNMNLQTMLIAAVITVVAVFLPHI
jgi:predicted nucleic acid-binding Zn ribbon protein